jgi:hypothetical protein
MNSLRVIVSTVVCLSLGVHLGCVVVAALKSGQVEYTSTSRFVFKRSNPAGYWALVALFSIVALGSIAAWAKVVYEAIVE